MSIFRWHEHSHEFQRKHQKYEYTTFPPARATGSHYLNTNLLFEGLGFPEVNRFDGASWHGRRVIIGAAWGSDSGRGAIAGSASLNDATGH